MEEEDSDWDEGPSIEEIISSVVKRKSKFGSSCGALPSRPSSAVKNQHRETSSSPENDQVPKSKTVELKSCFQKNVRADSKTSSSVLGVLHETSTVGKCEGRLLAKQDASNIQSRQNMSLVLNHKMQRSISTPEVKSRSLVNPLKNFKAENSKPTDNQQISPFINQSNHSINNDVIGDKENKIPNADSVKKWRAEHSDILKLVGKRPFQDAVESMDTDGFNVKGNARQVELMQQPCTKDSIVQEENIPSSSNFDSDLQLPKKANTTSFPCKILSQSLKTSSTLNSHHIRASAVIEAHEPMEVRSKSNSPTSGSHIDKSSSVTNSKLTASCIPQTNVQLTQCKQDDATLSKETCHGSVQDNNCKCSQQLTNGNNVCSKQTSVNSITVKQKDDVPSSAHLKPNPPTPSRQKLKNIDNIEVNGHDYFKLGVIGKGGSSKVYEVLDLETRKVKAIKLVDLEGLDKDTLKSYKNEIDLLQRLQWSDRVIKLYDYEHIGNSLKLVMEKGSQDMASLLNSTRGSRAAPISPFTIKHYWHGMLLAVQAIHQEGIIHSDLKPANFVLVSQTVKLIDFGIASSIQQDMTSVIKDSQAGTFNYMSPESLMDVHTGPLINNLSVDKVTIKIGVKSDVWSLGCILYNLVYGRTPFQHIGNPLKKLAAISDPNTEIAFKDIEDKHLMDVMQQCLKFDLRKRPSIQQLLQHPYLTDKTHSNYSSPEKPSHLKSAIDQLAKLTPSSLNKITSMIQQMKPEPNT